MYRPYFVGHQYKYRILACFIFGGLVGLSTPEVKAAQNLYIGNSHTPSGVQQYNLPISGSSTPNFTIAANNLLSEVAIDAHGNLAVGNNGGLTNLAFFTAPLSGASTPSATFKNGTATSAFQIVFTPAGDFFASTGASSGVNKFTHPFSNASTPSQSITNAGLTAAEGVALDAAQNLYISNAGGGGGNLFVYAPPYSGAPIITPDVAGTAYRKVVVSGTQLFVAAVAGAATGRLDVYTLPITASSAPAFSITNGMNIPEAVALDAAGNLYVGNFGNTTVTVYNPPFSASSAPSTTLSVGPAPFSLFSIAIGNSAISTVVPALLLLLL